MPYIKVTANAPISAEKQDAIKTQLGKDSALIGKTESWLMVELCENSALYFKGSNSAAAIVSVDLFGGSSKEEYNKMTAAITKLLNEQLNISADRIFVKYSEYSHWGWNGNNF